jgi:probable F420-dependent oxidoreductase
MRAATLLEDLGFDEIWYPEHVVHFPEYRSEYPYGAGGRNEVHRLRGTMQPFVMMAAMAAVTSRIRYGTHVCVVAERHPIHLAREVAALDLISGGRFDFGVGVGWLEQEYTALAVPFADRGRRTDECLAAMRALWTEEVVEFHGEFYEFEPLYAFPKPAQRPHPPIMVGGHSAAAVRRIVEHGDGWLGYNLEFDEVDSFLSRLDSAMTAAGRSMSELTLHLCRRPAGPEESEWEKVAIYAERCPQYGIDQVLISARIPVEDYEPLTRKMASVLGLGG